MKKIFIIAGCIITIIATVSCNRVRRDTGHSYMPDMTYSAAYETYAPAQERLDKYGAYYNNRPVEGAIARGDAFPYTLKNDSAGYIASANVKNPLAPPDAARTTEATRLYLVNCGICHGPKLDGNGPLFNNTAGPFTAAPKNFMADDMKAMPEGTMFHSVTYGKGQMGSYASQLSTEQRWMIIQYIKEKQKGLADTASKAGIDSVAAKPKTDSAGIATAPK